MGSHAFLFRAEVENDTIYGEFRSGNHYKSRWKAFRNDDFELADPYQMSKAAGEPIDFSFPDVNGNPWRFAENTAQAKVKLINIMGTWCPNCKDELRFLKEIVEQYGTEEISVVSIAFEKYKDQREALSVMKKYKDVMGMDWPFLLGGSASKAEAAEKLPFIDTVYSFPTLLILDKNNRIADVHTGFYGPATNRYATFKNEFKTRLDQLIKE